MAPFDPSFRKYLWDYLLILTGVLGGSLLLVGVVAAFGRDLPGFLGLTQIMPPIGPPLLHPILTHLVAVIVLAIPPALGILTILYLDYLTQR